MSISSSDPEPAIQASEIGKEVNALVAEYLTDQHTCRITNPISADEMRALIDEPIPGKGISFREVLDLYKERIVPHTMVSTSPGYFGLMNPTPLPITIFADSLTSALNQNQAAASHSPIGSVVEETVIRWLGEATGYGSDCSGHLTSGGTVANLTGLKLALHRSAPEVRDIGLAGLGKKFTVYVSDQAHFSFIRSVDVLGLGREALRSIPAGQNASVEVADIRTAIEIDRKEGFVPLAIVGIAGTTAAGSIDPLDDLADLAEETGLWFHVDAAYGGAAGFSTLYPDLLHGIERADSVTVDAHKWFFVPFVAGGILYREARSGLDAFHAMAGYVPDSQTAPGKPPTDYYQCGLAGTRRFNALKVWMAIKQMGADWYSETVNRQLKLARDFAERINDMPEWQLAMEPATAIVTFRYEPQQIGDAINKGGKEKETALRKRDALQHRIATAVQKDGRFWISSAPVPGGTALRMNVISYLTDETILEAFLESLPAYKNVAGN